LAPEAATGGCVTTGAVTGSCVGPTGSKCMLSGSQWQLSKYGWAPLAVTRCCVGPTGSKCMLSGSQWQLSKSGWAPLAVTGCWVKPSGLNTTLYGSQAVIGGCVGP